MYLYIVFIFVWLLIEYFRLSNGFYGNINESFPEIVSFFLLCLFNFGLIIAKLVLKQKFPLERSIILIQLIFMILEMLIW